MNVSKVLLRLGVFVGLISWPASAVAQSAIAGVVKDASGGVLPGVTVEASSPALIEKVRAVTTDGAGQYKVVDLRPGLYTITFTLPGFQSLKREGIDLPGEFTATIDAALRVGSLEETIVVSGASPVVDVRSATQVQIVNRDVVDNIPTGKSIQSIGQLMVGVKLSAPDVGGSRVSGSQTYMSIHGQGPAENNATIDGLLANSIESNGAVLGFYSQATIQEVTYQTSGGSAERSGGGVGMNMIPREGGNRFFGFGDITDRPGQWQGNNFSQRLKNLGVTSVDGISYIFDTSISEGGPVKKDKLWFFASTQTTPTTYLVPNTFYDNGKQGDDYNYLAHGNGRGTWQVSPRNKFTAFYDRVHKGRNHNMPALTDPETAALYWKWKNMSTGQAKYTSTVTNKFLVEAGATFNWSLRDETGQPGTEFDRLTQEWYANASRTTQTAGPRSTFPAVAGRAYKRSWAAAISGSYVTGSHHIKLGINDQFGSFFHDSLTNADLVQRYSTYTIDPVTHNFTFVGPIDVLVYNTPLKSSERLDANLGVYAQDSWTMNRLTINYGLRWEYLNSSVNASQVPAGRFVPARTSPVVPNVPSWKDWAPRFGAVYDLFGNGKTAVKYSLNRYNLAQTTSIAAGFNALGASSTGAVTWTDLNGDNIAQGERAWNAAGTAYTDCIYLSPGCELNLSQLRSNFGLLSDVGTYQGFPRGWNLEQNLEVQHELIPRLSVGAAYYHRSLHNITKIVNTALQSGDFTPLTIFNPIDGTPITYYNISAAANARATKNVTAVEPLRKGLYDSYSVDFRMRLPGGGQVFGGTAFERGLNVDCETSIAGAIVDPNSLRFCDDRKNGIPFAKDLRLAMSYPLPKGIILGGTYQDNDGGTLSQTYTFSKTIRYPDGTAAFRNAGGQVVPVCPTQNGCVPGAITANTLTLASASLALIPNGSRREERLHQLDLKASKNYRMGTLNITPFLEVFNVTNADTILTLTSTAYANAAGTYLQPASVLNGRIIGVGANVKW